MQTFRLQFSSSKNGEKLFSKGYGNLNSVYKFLFSNVDGKETFAN